MSADPFRHFDSYCGDFLFANPDSSVRGETTTFHTARCNGANRGFFEISEPLVQVRAVVSQAEDWINHELVWAMVGDIPTSISRLD